MRKRCMTMIAGIMTIHSLGMRAQAVDMEEGHVAYETNAKLCTLDGTFDGLSRSHKYRLEAASAVTPPVGYWGDGVLSKKVTVYTK